MSDLFTRSRTVIRRNFKELEPKLAVGLLTGSVTGFVLDLAAQNHITIPVTWQHFIVVVGFFLGGYIKSSSFPTIQDIETDLPAAEALAEKLVKHPVSLHTSPVAIVNAQNEKVTPADLNATLVTPSADNKPTEVLAPPYSRGQNFLDNLPSAQATPPSNPLKDV